MFISFLSASDLTRGDEARWRSCGRSNLTLRAAIMDEQGNLCGPGERGEIVVRGSLVIPGYYKNPQASAAVQREGWHCTGDVGFRDAAGFFYIVDRKKDMIITGGFNVFSAEVEHVILSHPAVRDCAVIGVPDSKWGEAIKAIVQLKQDASASEDDLISLVKGTLGSVHAPKSVEFWAELPRSPAGKVLKRDIRDRYWQGAERNV